MVSITIENLTKRFGQVVALDGINLRIEPGEIFFLLGPSGCGKTTLLRSIAGFCAIESGRILFGEEDVSAVPPHRRNTGMMFQSYALWPHLTVAQNVAFGLEERRVSARATAERVALALASVKMEGLGGRKIQELSGGQQQRVALARALVIRPRCLLLDEPLSNLDARLRLEMRGEIRRICQEFGLTAIYVTHDQKEALSIADRMAVLESGQIRQIGKPAEIYRRPESRFVADFMGETNFLVGKIVSIDRQMVEVETGLGTLRGTLGGMGWEPRIGGECLLSIRPESWRLEVESGRENEVAGRLTERVYLGEVGQYQFETTSEKLKILELNPRFIEEQPVGGLFASVNPEDVLALPL